MMQFIIHGHSFSSPQQHIFDGRDRFKTFLRKTCVDFVDNNVKKGKPSQRISGCGMLLEMLQLVALVLCPPLPLHSQKWRGTCPSQVYGAGASACSDVQFSVKYSGTEFNGCVIKSSAQSSPISMAQRTLQPVKYRSGQAVLVETSQCLITNCAL